MTGAGDHAVLEAARDEQVSPIFSATPGAEGMRDFSSLLSPEPEINLPEIRSEQLAIVMHTSGTTSAPKGAMMRHRDLMFNVTAAINAHDFAPSDVHLLVNPMFHCTALYSSLPLATYQKSPVIITADSSPAHLLKLVARERITTFLSVPSVFARITALPEAHRCDCSSLRVIAYAGSPMPLATIHALKEHFPGVDLHNFFGLTETTSMTHVLRTREAEERPDSIGRLLPFVFAMIVDEQAHPLPPGKSGELLFARNNVIPGYYRDPGRLEASFAEINGTLWFRTGDVASVDDEGFFYLKGRRKDMIIVGGENVFAAEVERVLAEHAWVQEAAVVGVPATGVRASLGEMIHAFVVAKRPQLTEREIRRHCHNRLPSYKIPHLVTFLHALPRNPAGKVVKRELPADIPGEGNNF